MKNGLLIIGAITIVGAGGYLLVRDDTPTDTVSITTEEIEQLPPNAINRDFSRFLAITPPAENVPNFIPANSTQYGDLPMEGLAINSTFYTRFNVDTAAAQTFKDKTNLTINPQDYLMIIGFTDNTPMGLGYDVDFGLGILPTSDDAGLLPLDPAGSEPIVINPNRYALFTSGADEGWSETAVLDVTNGYMPTGFSGFSFFATDSQIFGFLVEDVLFGDSPDLTLQTFVRETPEGQEVSADDPSGGFGFTQTANINSTLMSEIFADGFESGDTSAWSTAN